MSFFTQEYLQEVIPKDNVGIKVDGIIWVRPGYEEDDIKKTFYNIDNRKQGVIHIE